MINCRYRSINWSISWYSDLRAREAEHTNADLRHASMDRQDPDSQDASGDIHVNLDSSLYAGMTQLSFLLQLTSLRVVYTQNASPVEEDKYKELSTMGLVTLFLKGKILQKLLGGMSRSPQAGSGGLLGRKAVMAAVAAMLLKRAFRRR